MHKLFLHTGLALALALTGCGEDIAGVPKSQLPVPSRAPMRTTSRYPSVVKVDGARPCSGVAVGTKAVLSSSHCFSGGALAAVVPLRGAPVRTKAPIYYPFQDVALLLLENDLPEEIRDALPTMATSIRPGEVVTLVGFGDGRGIRRMGMPFFGTNMVYQLGQYIELNTPVERAPRSCFNRAAATQGDSGGALFKEEGTKLKLAGIIMAHDPNKEDYTSQAVNVTTEAFRNFLRQHAGI